MNMKTQILALAVTATLSSSVFANEYARCATSCRVDANRAIEDCNDSYRSNHRSLNEERQSVYQGLAEDSLRKSQEALSRSMGGSTAGSGNVFLDIAQQIGDYQNARGASKQTGRDFNRAFSRAGNDAKYCGQRAKNEMSRCEALCY